jgi:hypothetical protein
MKIPNELVPIAYALSQKVFEGNLTFKEGKEQLVGEDRMNPNSAADYINNFRSLMEGKKFIRHLNAYSADYYLANIYKDYGSTQLAITLKSLRLYMDYNEKLANVTMRKMRAIEVKYSAMLG